MKDKLISLLTTIIWIFTLSGCQKDNQFNSSIPEIEGWKIDSTDFVYNWVSPTEIDFLNPNIGYIIGTNGYLLKTTDSGKSWVKSYIEKDSSAVMTSSISFINETTGYIYGYYNVLNGNWYGVLYKTTDGGEKWQKQYYSTVYHMHSMKFFDINNGIALNVVNSGAYILTTGNGGLSWEVGTVEVSDYNLFFLGDICYVKGKNQKILKSVDHGKNWQTINTPVSSSSFIHGFYFMNEDTGFLATGDKKYKTVDGGNTWTETALPFYFDTPSSPWEYFHFSNTNDGIAFLMVTDYIGGDFPSLIGTYVYTTTNGGNSWKKSELFKNFSFGKIVYISNDLAYCIGYKYMYTLQKI
jgi:photosystem II stability/assembly factor-like uncharacterized protein